MLHTLLGANGAIGRLLAQELATAGLPVRLVSRSPRPLASATETVSADLLDAAATDRAVAGSEVVYLVAGLPYKAAVWAEEWPRVMAHVVEACARHRSRLVFLDNVYAYGLVEGDMTEETPFNPCSRKGEVRAQIATFLLEAMQRGEVNAMIVRSADFYGPKVLQSLVHALVFARLQAQKAPQWIGDPAMPHAFTYTPDLAHALAVLGRTEAAFGHTWHAPTSGDPIAGADFVRRACEAAGQPYRLQQIPPWLLYALGWGMPVLRENREMMYQLNRPYRFSSARIEAAFGLTPTSYSDGIARCVEA